jgi:steroid 5-alpha reductase family enzyme
MLLRRILRCKRDEITECWRRLCDEHLHNFYSLPNKIRMITSGRMRWVRHVAYMVEMGNVHRILVINLTEKDTTQRNWVCMGG